MRTTTLTVSPPFFDILVMSGQGQVGMRTDRPRDHDRWEMGGACSNRSIIDGNDERNTIPKYPEYEYAPTR